MRALVLIMPIFLTAQLASAQPTPAPSMPTPSMDQPTNLGKPLPRRTSKTYSVPSTGSERQLVRSYGDVGDDCRNNGLPEVELIEKPARGKVVVAKTELKVSMDAQKCPGETVEGIGIIFEPLLKSLGDPDRFVIKIKFRNGDETTDTWNITPRKS